MYLLWNTISRVLFDNLPRTDSYRILINYWYLLRTTFLDYLPIYSQNTHVYYITCWVYGKHCNY